MNEKKELVFRAPLAEDASLFSNKAGRGEGLFMASLAECLSEGVSLEPELEVSADEIIPCGEMEPDEDEAVWLSF